MTRGLKPQGTRLVQRLDGLDVAKARLMAAHGRCCVPVPQVWLRKIGNVCLRRRTLPCSWIPSLINSNAALFRAIWQFAGRAALVAEPSSFFTTEIAGEPIVVVRDGDGTLRAFYNVCRHRAAPVVTEAAGKASRLRCRYHGCQASDGGLGQSITAAARVLGRQADDGAPRRRLNLAGSPQAAPGASCRLPVVRLASRAPRSLLPSLLGRLFFRLTSSASRPSLWR
jgi:hypothetical protein